MFAESGLTALFIDVDDTIVRYRGGKKKSFIEVLQEAGMLFSGLSAEEAARRIERIQREIRWWHWSDFIVELELNPKKFWTYALEVERTYLEPTGPEMLGALQQMKDAGLLLYITSNNPSSGMLHKLRLAGLATMQDSSLFTQLLGATELQAMKWEPIYWKKVLAHTGLEASEVAVLGDNPHDDYLVPQSIGICHSFLLDRELDHSALNDSSVTWVRSFDEVANRILNPLSRHFARGDHSPGKVLKTERETLQDRTGLRTIPA